MPDAIVRWLPEGTVPTEGDFRDTVITPGRAPVQLERCANGRMALARARFDPVRDGMRAWVKDGDRIYAPDEIEPKS
ncbi:hypothetical protein [Chenggangzhangella methanolivorans]|uniref:Uncharacterized protein n=1 Tax=Chenggangzhangella methanolivorans TaxID=1437009 RepID=A0A9E6UPQ3_9HYPH|nr:hypothetical protein [Chenggangzhangella methanolivorans]QZO01654.1 hypothetical protein K6K41_09790 [Chenggangzhangella methanolivorans]